MGLQSAEVISPRDPVQNGLDPTGDGLDLDFEFLDDKSLYEEIARYELFLTREEMGNCCELMMGEVLPDAAPEDDLEQVHNWKTRIDRACSRLRIQADPHNWSTEEVLRWCLDTLQVLNLPSDPSTVAGLTVDGTTLCMLKAEDFMSRAPRVGDSLYSELATWKSASFHLPSLSESLDSGYNPSDDTTPIYLDLDTSDLHRHESSSCDEGMTSSLRCIYSSETTDAYRRNHELLLGTRNPLFSETSSGSDRDDRGIVSRCVTIQTHPPSQVSTETTRSTLPDCKNWPMRERPSTHLWQFLKELLNQSSIYDDCIRWIDRKNGVFRIENSTRVAKLWGERKRRPAMNYDKLSRSIRQYYKKGIIRKTEQSKRLVYQFCPLYI